MLRTFLPESITLPGGQVLACRTSYIPGIGPSKEDLIARAKKIGARYRCVEVLARGHRVRNDIHGRPYQPSTWIMSDMDLRQAATKD